MVKIKGAVIMNYYRFSSRQIGCLQESIILDDSCRRPELSRSEQN